MQVDFANVESFKSLFNSIDIFEDVKFICTPEEIKFKALDKSHTTFVQVSMNNDYFLDYECESIEEFCIDVLKVKKCLKSIKNELILKYDAGKIVLKSGNKKFELFEVDSDYSSPDLPKIPCDYSATIPLSFMKECLKDCELFSQEIYFNTSNNEFKISTEGVDGVYDNTYTCDKELEPSRCKFNTEKMKILLGADKISSEVTIRGKTDTPLTLSIKDTGITVEYLLAPLISVEG